ncbi:MAG: beta strand repeat-containing protein [Phycisphaerales bacterium JB065]
MRAFLRAGLAAIAATVLATTTFGAGVQITQPRVGDNEFVGPNTVVTFSVDAGLDGLSMTDGQPMTVEARLIGADGTLFGSAVTVTILGGPVNYNNAGNTGLQIDMNDRNGDGTPGDFVFSTAQWSSIVNASGGVRLRVFTPGDGGATTEFDAADETQDEVMRADNSGPRITSAQVNADGSLLLLNFSERIRVAADGDVANDDNQTITASVGNNDFQANTTNSFGGATPTASGITGVTLGSDFQSLTLTLDNSDLPGNSTNLQLGRWLRPNTPDAANLDLKDVMANIAQANSIQITSVPDLAVTGVVFTKRVPANGGTVVEALRVDFNNELASAGVAGAYTIDLVGDVATDITVNAVSVSGSSVLIDLDSSGGALDGISADGLLTASGGDPNDGLFRITIDSATGPTDIFTQTLPADVEDRAVADEIAPALEFVSFHDLNGDGELDAVGLVFDEAMASTTSTSGLTATPIDTAGVNPVSQIVTEGFAADLGSFTGATISNAGSNPLTITTTRGSVDLVIDGDPLDDRETNNTILLNFDPQTFDWDNDGDTAEDGDTEEAIPGTGDANAIRAAYNAAAGEIADQAGNDAPTIGVTNADTDRANPVLVFAGFLTGDNQDELTSNRQLVVEQRPAGDSTDVGDRDDNRVVFVYSEPIESTAGDTSVSNANVEEEQITFGGTPFADGELIDALTTANTFTIVNSDVTINDSISVLAASTLVDAAGNPATASATEQTNKQAPFIGLTSQGGMVVDSAFLLDDDDDGNADQIIAQFNQAVVLSLLDASDFSISVGSIDGLTTDTGSDSNGVVFEVSGVSMLDTPTITYNGADADAADRAIQGVTSGMNVSAVNGQTFVAQAIEAADPNAQGPAIMLLSGRVLLSTDGNQAIPAPIGTKIYAAVAVPTVKKVTATHNNLTFAYERTSGDDSVASQRSLQSLTNWLLELNDYVYLHRGPDNVRVYTNTPETSGDPDYDFLTDTIQLQFVTSNLAAIRFTGTGEEANDRITGGLLELAWDVPRSADGTTEAIYSSGYDLDGAPILSQATVTSADGSYDLYVSAPISSFTGRNRLSSQLNPVIIVAELPSGERYPVSSLLSSIDGEPIRFQPQNRTEENNNTASNAVEFDIDISKVGAERIYPGWNTVPFARQSGWAQSSTRRPTLPTNIQTSEIVLGQNLIAAGPLDQFVYWIEDADGDLTGDDGIWTADDDRASPLDSMLIDRNQIKSFAFTMTNFGVQFGSSINNLVGGYAFGMFNATSESYGVFQFGDALNASSVFPTAGFPNNSITDGWVLATVSSAYPNANGFFPANNRTDFILVFLNEGDGFTVGSLDSTGDEDNPNDLNSIDQNTPAFIHYR